VINSTIAGAAAVEALPTTKDERDGATARWAQPLPHSTPGFQEGPAVESRCDMREHFVAPMRRHTWQESALATKEASSSGAIGSSKDDTNKNSAVTLCPNTPVNVVPRLMCSKELP